ncbi:peptide ABC transporter permease [Pectobacterium araliae]|uniref:ABC transporter permease n=1 Tax=Pectobacterium araliae TaxID=3073862 RepID=A0AAN0KAW7_9GAMM|nr:ABC transporter permease [Pectobacterium sp. MAFF 302110]GKW21611.1 peptide ABC transporter permease [Pectobacterium carotovorum subsp. carotovorum]
MTNFAHFSVEKHVPEARQARQYVDKQLPSTLIIGAVITSIVVVMAVMAPILATHDPIAQNLSNQLSVPSVKHWLGTDYLGRDIWSRLIFGARTDLRIAFFAALLPAVIGTLMGCIVGFIGGVFQWLLLRIADCLIAFPFYLVVLIVVFAFGSGETGIYVAFATVGWIPYVRVMSAATEAAKRQEWALAARAAGLSQLRVIFVHIFPNIVAQPITMFVVDMVYVIVAIITLGYLGLGIQPPVPDWGAMIADGQAFVTTQWWIPVIPGTAVIITGIGLSFLADGMTQLLRPEV